MQVISLQSGSNGNCTYVEAGGVRLLLDAGISGSQAEERLARHGRDIRDVDAMIISHDHSDHTRCLGIYQRKFGLPVYITRATLTTASKKERLGTLSQIHYFTAGQTLNFGSVQIHTVATPHDAVEGVVFVVDDGTRRLGVLTDLGHTFSGLAELLGTLDAVLIESNHDGDMLARGPYPEFLKGRIRGPGGHLSNVESAELLAAAASRRLQWACLAHLSQENNDPELALATHRHVLGKRIPLFVASRYAASDVLDV